jgi:hypothetical protein
MADRGERSYEAQILDNNPEVRAAVSESEAFRAWKEDLPTVNVDQVRYYVRGGDMLKDEDQIMLEWARRFRPGLLPPEETP